MTKRGWMLAAAAVTLVACSGDDDPDPAADAEVIEAALLRSDDLPPGFTSQPVEDEDDSTVVEACADLLGIDGAGIDAAKTAETGLVQFQSETTMRVSAEITAFDDADVPRQLINGFADDDFFECYLDQFAADFAPGVTLTSSGTDALAIDSERVDAGTALVLEFDIDGAPAHARAELALVDRYAIALQTSALEGDLDGAVAADALSAMVDRLNA
jgi:hypothetical protein